MKTYDVPLLAGEAPLTFKGTLHSLIISLNPKAYEAFWMDNTGYYCFPGPRENSAEFRVLPTPNLDILTRALRSDLLLMKDRSNNRQAAIINPVGLFGLVYWHSLYRPHRLIFAGMLRAMARAAEKEGEPKAEPQFREYCFSFILG